MSIFCRFFVDFLSIFDFDVLTLFLSGLGSSNYKKSTKNLQKIYKKMPFVDFSGGFVEICRFFVDMWLGKDSGSVYWWIGKPFWLNCMAQLRHCDGLSLRSAQEEGSSSTTLKRAHGSGPSHDEAAQVAKPAPAMLAWILYAPTKIDSNWLKAFSNCTKRSCL